MIRPLGRLRTMWKIFQHTEARTMHPPLSSFSKPQASKLLHLGSFKGTGLRSYSSQSSRNARPDPGPRPGGSEPSSLSARLRMLSKEYGYTALGVYFGLWVLDFPVSFFAVQYLGVERIGRWKHTVVEGGKDILREWFPGKLSERCEYEAPMVASEHKNGSVDKEIGKANIWTQLALAFVIHKFFTFFRVPLTAAVTPKVVKTLRGWGYNIGKRKPMAG